MSMIDHIPFSLDTPQVTVKGHLSPMNLSPPYDRFHVMVYERGGTYYHGQLLFHHDKWHLPDSKLEPYAEELGHVVEVWYQ